MSFRGQFKYDYVRFLAELAKSANISGSAREAGIPRKAIENRMARDPDFRLLVDTIRPVPFESPKSDWTRLLDLVRAGASPHAALRQPGMPSTTTFYRAIARNPELRDEIKRLTGGRTKRAAGNAISEDVWAKVINQIQDGRSVAEISRSAGMPSRSAFKDKARRDRSFAALVKSARNSASDNQLASALRQNDLFLSASKAVPTRYPQDVRDDIVSMIVLAVLEDEFPAAEIPLHAKKFISAYYRASDFHRTTSIDATIPGTDGLRLIDVIAAEPATSFEDYA